MFERFTDRIRKVMALANQEAQRWNHEYINTEHILLGLIKEGSGVGATVLKNLDVDINKLRSEVEKLVKRGPDMVTHGKLPQAPLAKKVIECAIEECRSLNHNYVGTEHLLLGLLRESEGIAAQVLMNLGLKFEDVRQEVLNLVGAGVDDGPAALGKKMSPTIGRKNEIECFTGRARKVMALADQEARRFNHEYIGTEHILLGLVREGSGVGARVLKNLVVDIKMLRLEVEKLVKIGPDMVAMGKLPQTPRAKKVIEYAIEEALSFNHNYVGTEHILLGLLLVDDGIAAQVLMNLDLQIERVRSEVLMLVNKRKEISRERETRTCGDKGENKLLMKREGSGAMEQDEQYLGLLSIFHYVVGGLAACFACIPLIHFCIGVVLTGAIEGPPAFVGLMFAVMSIVAVTIGWVFAVCLIFAGKSLARRRRYMFCLVMAAISCMFMPFGTVLGVFTIIVLMRPAVKGLFEIN